jgi:hypothetical protein
VAARELKSVRFDGFWLSLYHIEHHCQQRRTESKSLPEQNRKHYKTERSKAEKRAVMSWEERESKYIAEKKQRGI